MLQSAKCVLVEENVFASCVRRGEKCSWFCLESEQFNKFRVQAPELLVQTVGFSDLALEKFWSFATVHHIYCQLACRQLQNEENRFHGSTS